MDLDKNFKIEDLSAEIRAEIDVFISLLKKAYPNVQAVIVFDDPSHMNDRTDGQIDLCVVSDDFAVPTGCSVHIPCRGGSCIVSKYEEKLDDLASEAEEIKKTYAIEIKPYPMSVEMYLSGDTYYTSIYNRSDLYYGDKKYDPKKVNSEINWDAVYNKAVSYEGETHNGAPFEKDGKPHGVGRMVYYDGTVYEGGFKNGGYCGKGVIYYANGDRLEGEFVEKYAHWGLGDFCGDGVMYHADGTRYEGWFNYGDKHSLGTLYDKNGNVLYGTDDGEWERGVLYPYKPMTLEECIACSLKGKDGDWCSLCHKKIEGVDFKMSAGRQYKEGLDCETSATNLERNIKAGTVDPKHTHEIEKNLKKAKTHYKNAANYGHKEAERAYKRLENVGYEGETNADGKPHGKGTKYREKAIFEGEWFDGSFVKGKVFHSNGDKYEGEYKDDKLSFGAYTFQNGQRYEGGWIDGKINGKGIYTYEGFRYEGEFKDMEFDGYGIYLYSVGNRYEGGWKEGNFHGKGVFTYANGQRFEGYFLHAKASNGMDGAFFFEDGIEGKDKNFSGEAVFFWGSGQRYEGGFKDGKWHGKGKRFGNDGKCNFEGGFKNDKQHGKGTTFYYGGTSREEEYVNGSKVEK
jgi:hypothetical protein